MAENRVVRLDDERLDQLIDQLRPRDGLAIQLRYGLAGEPPMTFKAIGKRLGTGRERARQLFLRGMRGLRFRLKREAPQGLESLSDRRLALMQESLLRYG